MTDPRKTLAQIKKLLFSRDAASVAQGVELLRALDDAKLFDDLLAGVAWSFTPPTEGRPPAYGVLKIGGQCANAGVKARWDLVVALALIAAAPPESRVAAKITAEATSLTVERGFDYRAAFEIDLSPLRAFVNLERLWVRAAGPVTHLDALAALPKLREVQLDGPIQDVAGLSGSRSLARLTVSSSSFERPGPLRDVPALRELDLRSSYNLRAIDFLADLDGLEQLTISLHAHSGGDLAPMRGLRSLKVLTIENGNSAVASVEPLAALTALESLRIDRCGSITTLAPLRALPKLRTLAVDSLGKLATLGLDGITTLRHFTTRWGAIKEIDCLGDCALEHVDLNSAMLLDSLKGLRSTSSIRALHLASEVIGSFEGLEACVDLEHVALRAAKNLTSLAGLQNATKLKSLTLPRCASLTSLDGIERFADLTLCILEGGAFSDITALSKLTSLERLSLRGCSKVTDISALASLPKLKALILTGTGVDRSTLPANLRHFTSFAQDADLEKLATKPPPEPRAPVIPVAVSAEHRKAWTQIKKLLLTRDAETIDQGVELVRALDDLSIFDELLKGVTWAPPDRLHPCGAVVTKGTWFEDTEPAKPFRVRAILALAAAAPDGCDAAKALRASLKMLSFDGRADPKRAATFDAAPLARFERLERLDLNHMPALTNAGVIGALRSLKVLAIRTPGLMDPIDFSALDALEEAEIHDVPVERVNELRAAKGLTRLSVSNLRGDGAIILDDHPSLKRVAVSTAPGVRTISLKRCAALTDVQLSWTQGVETLDVTGCAALTKIVAPSNARLSEIRGLETLTSLTLISTPHASVAWIPAAPLTGLTRLFSLDVSGNAFETCAALRAFPHLRSLSINSSTNLRDVSDLAALEHLNTLSVQYSPKLTDISALEGLPLTSFHARRCPIKPETVPLALKRFVK